MDEQDFPAEGYDGQAVVSPLVEVHGAPATSLETAEVSRPTSRLAGSHLSTSTGALASSTEQGVRVEVTLRGHFEPLDGRFHWYGRIAADDALAARHANGATVVLTTPHGRAEGRLSDVDPWGRYRISGTGRPPY